MEINANDQKQLTTPIDELVTIKIPGGAYRVTVVAKAEGSEKVLFKFGGSPIENIDDLNTNYLDEVIVDYSHQASTKTNTLYLYANAAIPVQWNFG